MISFIKTGLSRVTNTNLFKSSLAGTKGAFALGAAGLGAGAGYYLHGDSYGSGAGVFIGIGEGATSAALLKSMVSSPIRTSALAIPMSLGFMGIQHGRQHHRLRREIRMGKRQSDHYGLLQEMRMQSIRQLSQDRFNSNRTIGNEAMRLHR